MPTIKYTREGITKLENERDQFQLERDSLIKDVEKLREEKAAIEMYLDAIKTYKPMYECVNDKYKYLTNYIKDKALHNPSVSRYIDLVHVIDGLEREWVTMAKVDYKNAWQTLKEEMTQDYIKLTNSGDDIARIAGQVLSGYLERIDELDKSNDFSNLLHDMNREDK